jgi:hypothetical protein
MLSFKTNKYTINIYNLTILTYFWFFWLPLFDILYISHINEIVLFGDSVFNDIDSINDEKLSYIYFSANVFLIIYITFVYVVSKSRLLIVPNTSIISYVGGKFYFFYFIALIIILILFNTHNENATNWVDSGPGAFLVNIRMIVNILLLFAIYFLLNKDIKRKYTAPLFIILGIYLYYLLTKEPTRINLIGFVVALGVAYERGLNKVIKPSIIFFMGFFGMIFMITIAFTRTFVNSGISDIIPKIVDLFTELNIINIIRNYFEIYSGMEYYYRLLDNSYFVYNGLDYIIRFIAFFIPRSIYTDKPISISEVAGHIIGGEGFSCGVTAVGEVSLVYGISGVLFLAIFHSLTTVFFDKNTNNKFITLYFIGIATYAFQFLRGPLDSLFHRIVIIFFLTVILLRFKKISRFIKDN